MGGFKKALRQGLKKAVGFAKTKGLNELKRVGDKALGTATNGAVNVQDIQKIASQRNPTKIGKAVGRLAANTALKSLTAGKLNYSDAVQAYKLRNDPKALGKFALQKASDIGQGYADSALKGATGNIVDYQTAKLATQRGGLKQALQNIASNAANSGMQYATGGLLNANDASQIYQNRNNPQALAQMALNKGTNYAENQVADTAADALDVAAV